jgi:hypothetical protein
MEKEDMKPRMARKKKQMKDDETTENQKVEARR